MSIKKQFLKNKPECKVTFSIPEFVVPSKSKVYLSGNFNAWEEQSLRMTKNRETGDYSVTITLPINAEYQFRYNINSDFWVNDEAADGYVPNNIDGDNSLLILY